LPTRELFPWYVVQSTRGKFLAAQPFLEVEVVVVDVLVVDELEDVVDEVLLVVETFPGGEDSNAKAETATTTRTATPRTAPRFTMRESRLRPLRVLRSVIAS